MVLAVMLAVIMALLVPMRTVHAAHERYVSELYVAYGKTAEEAEKTLKDKGYTPIEGNLNDGGNTYVMMGYKTTDDIRDSITDIAVMNMRGDYSVEDYTTMLKKQKNTIADFLEEFMIVIKEYRANYAANKSRAIYVHDLLNKYKDDDSGMLLGDLLLADTLQDSVGALNSVGAENSKKLPDLINIMLQGNTEIIYSMELLLSMAADSGSESWIERFSDISFEGLLEEVEKSQPSLNTEAKRLQYLDNKYGDYAQAIVSDMARLRTKLLSYQESSIKLNATIEEIKKTFGDTESQKSEEALKSIAAMQQWTEGGVLYEGLAGYEGGSFKKGELLEFFLKEYEGDDIESIYPIAAALSEGQRAGLPFVSFERILSNSMISDEDWKKQADDAKTLIGELETVSVYANIDRDIYKDDGTVALTDSAVRNNNTVDGTTGSVWDHMDITSKITAISYAATALGFTAYGVSNALKGLFTSQVDYLGKAWSAFELDASSVEEIAELTKIENNLKAATSRMVTSTRITRYLGYATVALALIAATLTVIELLDNKGVQQLPIPKYIVDNRTDSEGNSYSINYKAVECNRWEYFGNRYLKQSGSSADLLADEGKQWLVLYVSKNSKAGNPVTEDIKVLNSEDAPGGFDGSIHLIGEKGAVNIASGAFRNYATYQQTWQMIVGEKEVYGFYVFSDAVKTYDASTGNMTASTFNYGLGAIIGAGGLVIGGVLGAVIAGTARKKKKAS